MGDLENKNPEEVKNLDDAFSGQPDDAGAAAGDATSVVPGSEDKNWESFGLERYDKMTREQIAQDINYRNKTYGDQSNELGRLRTVEEERDTLQAKIQQMTAITNPDAKKAAVDRVEKMSEGQLTDFFGQLEKDPRQAILSLLGDSVKGGRSEDDLKKIIQENVQEALFQYHGFSEEEAVKRNRPEFVEHEHYIKELSKPEHLGQNRGIEDLLDFTILQKENSTLAAVVYDKLKRYPSMNFQDCKKYSELELRSPDTEAAKKDELEKKVTGLQGGPPSSAKTKVSETDEVKTMDDAFDMPEK